MNVILLEVKRGKDGKFYPPTGNLPPDQLHRARQLAHNLHCRDGLPMRAAQRVMAEQYALRRSLGAIHRDLTQYACRFCNPGAF